MKYNQFNNRKALGCVFALSLIGVVFSSVRAYSENEYAGLWIGRVAVSHVSEVSVPLDEDNIPIAPNPDVPTPAHDEAYLRLILHVNGAGQVNLLKDVAVLLQDEDAVSGNLVGSESDYVLVTDESLYDNFPEQEAIRFASAVFDFSDDKATDAVDSMIDVVINNVAASVAGSSVTAGSSDTELRDAEQDALSAAINAVDLNPMNANNEFIAYLAANVTPSNLTVAATNQPLDLSSFTSSAGAYFTNSFYGDDRALAMVDGLEPVITNAVGSAAKEAAAHNLVSRYLDFDNAYQQFVTGFDFGDMIADAAQLAAHAVVTTNVVSNAVHEAVSVNDVREIALNKRIFAGYGYTDTSAPDAVEIVVDAIVNSAVANSSTNETVIAMDAEAAGLAALQNDVPRYEVHAPSDDYIAFVTSESFSDSVYTAAEAAALAAVKEAKNDSFYSLQTLQNAAKIAAVKAITVVYSEAARARQTELPMEGTFAPGATDLTGTIYLPANHPTNPFRHRRHPDHTVGFNIKRIIDIDFDAVESNQLIRASFGVDQISGTYHEEIFGLHKPLGPNSDIGLKVEGKFELNRVSHIDTLNSSN